jgi:hypothetical protein
MGTRGRARLAVVLLAGVLATAACSGRTTVEFETRALRGTAAGLTTTTLADGGTPSLAGVIGDAGSSAVSGSAAATGATAAGSGTSGAGAAAARGPGVNKLGNGHPHQGGQRDLG